MKCVCVCVCVCVTHVCTEFAQELYHQAILLPPYHEFLRGTIQPVRGALSHISFLGGKVKQRHLVSKKYQHSGLPEQSKNSFPSSATGAWF
jgi:hypothetical protein